MSQGENIPRIPALSKKPVDWSTLGILQSAKGFEFYFFNYDSVFDIEKMCKCYTQVRPQQIFLPETKKGRNFILIENVLHVTKKVCTI